MPENQGVAQLYSVLVNVVVVFSFLDASIVILGVSSQCIWIDIDVIVTEGIVRFLVVITMFVIIRAIVITFSEYVGRKSDSLR